MNHLEMSPLTFHGMARRITGDLHPGRSEAVMCYAVNLLAEVAAGTFSPAEAAECLRGLAAQAKPDEYAEAVRQTLEAIEPREWAAV
jgi:hypothetical protein